MTTFSKTTTPVGSAGEIHSYTGSPDCATFYAWVLSSLLDLMHPGFGAPNPPLTGITPGQMGNLGEAITYLVGHTERFSAPNFIASLGSALTPFNPSALTGIDILVLYLDPDGVEANDRLFIQEIKTTGGTELDYSKELIVDYKKLMDTTKPTLSLMSRISALKCKLKWEHRFTDDKLRRVENLAQTTAGSCSGIRLLPTLIHDRRRDASSALTHVINKINVQGWPPGSIEAWSISISKLDVNLVQMANRGPFIP